MFPGSNFSYLTSLRACEFSLMDPAYLIFVEREFLPRCTFLSLLHLGQCQRLPFDFN